MGLATVSSWILYRFLPVEEHTEPKMKHKKIPQKILWKIGKKKEKKLETLKNNNESNKKKMNK